MAGSDDWALLLPVDPDASARRLRDAIAAATGADVAVIVSDSHGRAWRFGTVGVAIGVAGMSRMMNANVLATSGRAIEAAGDVDVLLLDKTGTITLGNREAVRFVPAPGLSEQAVADAA